MTREEMIEIIIEGKRCEWLYTGDYDEMERILYSGFKGYENYSDKELGDEIKRLEDNIEHIKKLLELKKERRC